MGFAQGVYLTHYNLAYFAQALLALVAFAYLLTVKRKTRATWLLTFALGMLTLFLGGFWYAYSGFFSWFRFGIMAGAIICGLWSQECLLCFAYEFPNPDPALRREARLAAIISGATTLLGSCIGIAAILDWEALQQITPRFMGGITILLVAFAIIDCWAFGVLCRRTMRLATNRQAAWRRRLCLPQGRTAQALSAYIVICGIGLGTIMLRVGEQAGVIPSTLNEIIGALAPLIIMFLMVSVYFTYTPESSTVLIKIVGASLTLLLSVIAFTGFWLGNAEQAQYQPTLPIRAGTTLRFEPQPTGGYAIFNVDSTFEANLGADIAAHTSPRSALAFNFPFPFQGATWAAALISPYGSLTLTNDAAPRPISSYLDLDILRLTPNEPAIVPLLLKLSTAPDGGVFFAASPTHATITWQRMQAAGDAYTFQARLFASGVIEMTYVTLPNAFHYDAANPRYAPILTGILPGGADTPAAVQVLRAADPVTTLSEAFCWYYYAGFRVMLHRQIAPLYVIMMIASLIVLLVLPLYFHSFLLQPLYRLRDGVSQMETGRLDVALEVASHDELGSLTQTFNRMASSMFAAKQLLQEDNRTLEQRVAQRTDALSQALDDLQAAQVGLIQAEKMAALGKLVANIAHEINTPLGAIRASANNILSALDETFPHLPEVIRLLSDEQQAAFIGLILRACQPKQTLTSREERQHRRSLCQTLEAAAIADAETIADTLVDMGIYDEIAAFISLFRHEKAIWLFGAVAHIAAQRHSSENILFAVERMSKIVFALKSYAHIEASEQPTVARIQDGMEVVLTLYHNQLKHGIEVVKQYDDIPPMLCYPDELQQVWTNLIHNAIQAMQGKGRLEIAIVGANNYSPLQEGGAGIVVEITDSGGGISDEIKPRIFEPFFTTKPAGEGSGMGLDICKKIIDKHHGKIDVESQPGRTTFRVWLPQQ